MTKQPVILIIEDQLSIAMLLQSKLSECTNHTILLLQSLQEVKEVISSDEVEILVAMCDLNLPDAPDGEAVKVLKDQNVTTVVLTGTYKEETRLAMLDAMVADYVIKDGPASIDYAISTVRNLLHNVNKTIWILSLGQSSQRLLRLLRIHRYSVRVLETIESLEKLLETQKQPSLILLDGFSRYPKSKTVGFVQKVRSRFSKNVLPLIACESSDNISDAILLMKYGVNDFFNTSFSAEELYVRVRQNIDYTEAYKKIEITSQTDSLTGLSNRRFLFDKGAIFLSQVKSANQPYFLIMADIDHFKNVNDTYGHQVGDDAIVFTANQLKSYFDDCYVARFGGEEFCILGLGDKENVLTQCDQLRKKIEQESQSQSGAPFTLSQGVTFGFDSLEQGIAQADSKLYEAKETGRNKVVS